MPIESSMIRWSLGWALGAALTACTPLYPEPDSGPPNDLLFFKLSDPMLGVISSEKALGGSCRLVIHNVVVSSSSPDAGSGILGTTYLNFNAMGAPRPTTPLTNFSELGFRLDGPDVGGPLLFDYSLQQGSIAIALDPVVSWFFARNDSKTNYLTLSITNGTSSMQLVWSLDLSQCDPRPF
jgi:hypothetical protein